MIIPPSYPTWNLRVNFLVNYMDTLTCQVALSRTSNGCSWQKNVLNWFLMFKKVVDTLFFKIYKLYGYTYLASCAFKDFQWMFLATEQIELIFKESNGYSFLGWVGCLSVLWHKIWYACGGILLFAYLLIFFLLLFPFQYSLRMPYKASFLILLQVLMESFDRFFEFVRRSNAVSPTVALETANALQVSMSISWIRNHMVSKLTLYSFNATCRWRLRKWLEERKSNFKWY